MRRIATLIASLLLLLTGCSRKLTVHNRTLSEDSPAGYAAVVDVKSPKAYMLLFSGFGETPADVLAATDMPLELARHGIAVFIPVLQNGSETYGFSDESQLWVERIVEDIHNRYGMNDLPYFVGGFSMGGATAVKYAESVSQKPKAVFVIDSPLDYNRFLYATKRDIEVYGKDNQDSIYSILYSDIARIKDESPYFINDTTHSAILSLKDIPTRVYIEPAEEWWLNNRSTDALGLNILDATCFVNDLRLIGNENAELTVTSNKGVRKVSGQRHPHSWTIVDVGNLIKWLDNCLKQ